MGKKMRNKIPFLSMLNNIEIDTEKKTWNHSLGPLTNGLEILR